MDNVIKNLILSPLNILYRINPELELKLLFRAKQGYKLNLRNPKTYNEKLQWIKLYDHNPLMPKCCDKYTVRSFIKDMGCADILNKLIWVGFKPEDIPFDSLPEKYVIKVTHGSTFNIINDGTKPIDRSIVINNCRKWLRAKFLPCYGEWFYGIEKPRIIIEEYIESEDGQQLKDYKVFCFNGEPHYIRVDTDRFTNHRDIIYTTNWSPIPGAHMGHGCGEPTIQKPKCLSIMLEYSRKLSSPFKHVRVDFYVINERLVFGEITFTNGAGFDKFSPFELDIEMGKLLSLKDTLDDEGK